VATIAAPVGTGVGQFPTPSQLLTTGHIVVRKSVTADSTTQRSWLLYADAYTFYFFVHSENEVFYPFYMFGDIFSLRGTADAYRCMIIGQYLENSAPSVASTHDGDRLSLGSASTTTIATAYSGHYMARTVGGLGSSIAISKIGDNAFCYNNSNQVSFGGVMQYPNGPDNTIYLAPVRIAEVTGNILRGRMRGIYQLLHNPALFSNGQVIAGAGDFAGKTFQCVRDGNNIAASSTWCIETSATVETN